MRSMEAFRWSSVAPEIFSLFIVLILLGSLVPGGSVLAQGAAEVPNPGTDLWREVRQRGAADESGPAPGILAAGTHGC